MNIRTFNDPILKTVCEPIASGEDLLWLKDLEAACYEHNGVGLAAPQIGIAKRAIFIRFGKQHGMVMLNPVLSAHGTGVESLEEGCLSYPQIFTSVQRPTFVRCAWESPDGKKRSRIFGQARLGWRITESRVIQHEADHLDGICRVGDAWRKSMAIDVVEAAIAAEGKFQC